MRVTPEIRCIDCGSGNAYERLVAGVWDIHCPDCGATFGVGNLPSKCRECAKPLHKLEDRGRGLCVSCHVASWSPEKRAAINNLIGMAFRKPGPTDAEKDAAIDEALRHGGDASP
jgi:hypothetical protein